MDKIYETYSKIYKELLPNTEYALLQKDFLHWNKESSIIEIWLPID